MKISLPKVAAGLLTLILAVACASQSPPEIALDEQLAKLGYIIGPQARRIHNFQVNSWNIVDRKNVIIFPGASRYYLLTTKGICDGLLETRKLAFSTTIGVLTDKDQLLTRRYSGRLESCSIDTIHELQKEKDR